MTQATVDLLTEIINAWPNTIEGSSTKEKLSFVDDPIAMSCASWRLDQQGLGSYSNLETVIVESEDRVLAAKIRKHFLDKLTLQKLRGKEQSTFRTKLGAFLVGNHELTKDEIGLLYRLPFFYHEDQCVQQVMAQTEPVTLTTPVMDAAMSLTGLQKIWRHRRTGQATQFWFTNQHRWPVELTVLHSNPLYGIIDSLYDLGMFRINGRVWPRQFYESSRTYIKLSTFRLVGLGV
jgi:hypothetical protein